MYGGPLGDIGSVGWPPGCDVLYVDIEDLWGGLEVVVGPVG